MAKGKHTDKPASQRKRGPGPGPGSNSAVPSPRNSNNGGISKPAERARRPNTGNRTVDAATVANFVAKKAVPQLKHRTYIEIVDNEDKKEKKLEIEVTFKSEPPAGFEFVPIGNPELTTLCKDISREKEAMIFVVSNSKAHQNQLSVHMNRIGHHVRQYIVEEARQRLGQRGVAVATDALPKTQQEINAQADAALRDLFPRIPNTDRQEIIDHAFRLGATFHGEPVVGLQTDLSLSRRVQLAVLAHIRHNHTRYDELLKMTSWMQARKVVERPCLDLLVRWRGDEENGRDDLDEILREVVIISDDEDDSETEDDQVHDEYEQGRRKGPPACPAKVAAAASTRLSSSSKMQMPCPKTPAARPSPKDSDDVASPRFTILPNPLPARSPREIVHSDRDVLQGSITRHRYMRYHDAWRSAVDRNRANTVTRPGDGAVEVVYSVPPPPLPSSSSAPAVAATAETPYTGPGVLISGPAATPVRRDWAEITPAANVSRVQPRDGLRSPVTIFHPQPVRIPNTELTNHIATSIPVENDPQKLKDLLIPSIEGSPKQTIRRPVFVRAVNSGNGKRGRDSDSESSPCRRNPDSMAGDASNGSPRSKRRRIMNQESVYDTALSHGPGHYTGGYRTSKVPSQVFPGHTSSRVYSTAEPYRNSVDGAPQRGRDQRSVYQEPVIKRSFVSSHVPTKTYRESSARSTGHVTFPIGRSAQMGSTVSRPDIPRPVAPLPGMHDDGQWLNPHTTQPTPESYGVSIYQTPPLPHGSSRLPPRPVRGAVDTLYRSPHDILSYASDRAPSQSSNHTFFVRRVNHADKATVYSNPRDTGQYRSYHPGFHRAAPRGAPQPSQAPPPKTSTLGTPSRTTQSNQANPIILD